MPGANCFGGGGYSVGISNDFMDHAVALVCGKTDGWVLDLKNKTNSVSMTYTYWPPSAGSLGYHGKMHDVSCPEAGQVYLHIGFGLGAPDDIKYTLSTAACDNSHVNGKHGGQLVLGTFPGAAIDARFNDHLFYLADPAPRRDGRNMYCTNYQRFVPNAEDTIWLGEFKDHCYDAHEGFGGEDFWWTDPPGWKDHESGMAAHEGAKRECVTVKGGCYDGKGGTWDYYG